MSSRNIVMSAAGVGGETYIEDVFSTYLYTGNGSTQTITNGIDLAGKGGMVWCKCRTNAFAHRLVDTIRGAGNELYSNNTSGQVSAPTGLTAFNSNGFSVGALGGYNQNTDTYASWTFRKAPKFFDVVTYTGDGASSKVISHALGQTPGMILVKATSTTGYWTVWQRTINSTGNGYMFLNTTQAKFNDGEAVWGDGTTYTAPTDSNFTISSYANANGVTYVAYLFGHDTTTDGLIQCGSYTTNSLGEGTVNLGWEPQYVLVKAATGSSDWYMFDNMRGFTAQTTSGGGNAQRLKANLPAAEDNSGNYYLTNTGFVDTGGLVADGTVIYMAIRRGPMKTPTDGTTVFTPALGINCPAGGVMYNAGFPVDATFEGWGLGSGQYVVDRLRGNYRYLTTSNTTVEDSDGGYRAFDSNQGLKFNLAFNALTYKLIGWNFQRAPGFFDVVCYTGTGSVQNVTHNLTVAPELIIVKKRNGTGNWFVGAENFTYFLPLNLNYDKQTTSAAWNNTVPTASVFTAGTATSESAATYVAYLFASCPGVSKVGSYTGTGATQTISCGFTGGARFVLIKRTDSTGDWYVWDTARGMVSGTDPSLLLNSTAAEVNANSVYTTTGGFQIVSTAAGINASGGSYIYLAIA